MPMTIATKGFGSCTETPKQIIRSLNQNSRLRDPEYAINQQIAWEKDYCSRKRPASRLLDLFNPYEKPESELHPEFTVVNPRHISNRILFVASHGFWTLTVTKQDHGHDFTFQVKVDEGSMFHPKAIQQYILECRDEEAYTKWKSLVLEDFKTSVPWLVAEAKQLMPGLRAWSVVCCESSERLMKRTPDVHVQNQIAYLIL